MTTIPVASGRSRGRPVILLAIFLVNLLSHLFLLGQGPLSGTEGLRALPAHRMVQTGQ